MLTGNTTDSEGEEEESSNKAPLETMADQFNMALEQFREKWQQELKPTSSKTNIVSTNSSANASNSNLPPPELTEESRALILFMQAVELEKRGKVYDALSFYRKAIQIVPDIEFKFYETTNKAKLSTTETSNNNVLDDGDKENKNNHPAEIEDLSNVDLYDRFHNDLAKTENFIKRANAGSGVITTSKHISELPVEIIFYILRWVVSSQLDIRSLEQCAAVCKGLFLCARDDELWRLVCLKVWGVNTGLLSNTKFQSWREMYIERERVHFHGCYISKTTYLRYGENSFQDQFYRPVQLIEYYRYFRFFPDGNVIMWTTAEEPAQAVTKLKYVNQLRSEVLKGHYRLHGDIVTIMLKRNPKPINGAINLKRKGNFASDIDGNNSYTYYIELKVCSTAKRRFCQLQWKNYSIIQIKNKREVTSDFELTSSKYPTLWFSRVKSYHLDADAPL